MPYHLICRCLPATATVCPVREVERASRRAAAPGWQAKSGRWKAAAGGRRDFVPSDGDVPKNNRAPSKSAFFDGDVPFFCRPPSLFRMLRQGARDAPLSPRATAVPRHGAALRLPTGRLHPQPHGNPGGRTAPPLVSATAGVAFFCYLCRDYERIQTMGFPGGGRLRGGRHAGGRDGSGGGRAGEDYDEEVPPFRFHRPGDEGGAQRE